jgi:hypothetical protein
MSAAPDRAAGQTDAAPVFFVHLQKTAGTALWRRLHEQFAPVDLYPGPGDGELPTSVLSVEHLVERWKARGDEIRVVTGHFPLCTIELLGSTFTTITLLRDPVERTLSALRDLHQRSPELLGVPLERIYADPLRAPLLRNHMVRMLGMSTAEMTNGALSPFDVTPAHLERAQERLAGVDVVGVQERFDEFCATLTRRYGWDLGPPIFMNRTEPLPSPERLRERIAEDSALDVALYDSLAVT